MRVSVFAMTLSALGLSASVSAQQDRTDSDPNWAAIAQCASIDATEARHQCMDGVLRRAGLLGGAPIERDKQRELGRDTRSETPRKPTSTRSEATPQGNPAATADEVLTTVKAVQTVGYQRLRVTTAEGSVWQQTDAGAFTSGPEVGDRFSVVRGALGSYLCKFSNSSRYRCERRE